MDHDFLVERNHSIQWALASPMRKVQRARPQPTPDQKLSRFDHFCLNFFCCNNKILFIDNQKTMTNTQNVTGNRAGHGPIKIPEEGGKAFFCLNFQYFEFELWLGHHTPLYPLKKWFNGLVNLGGGCTRGMVALEGLVFTLSRDIISLLLDLSANFIKATSKMVNNRLTFKVASWGGEQ